MFVRISAKGDCLMDQEAVDIFSKMDKDEKNLMMKWILADRDYFSRFSTAKISRVIFNGPATIVFWSDGDKTVVKCMESDTYSYETGVAMCMLKKIFGKSYKDFKKYIKEIGK